MMTRFRVSRVAKPPPPRNSGISQQGARNGFLPGGGVLALGALETPDDQ